MMAKVEVISQTEVVGILYRVLGPDRGWSDFLADCARQRTNTNYHGLQLLPLCRLKTPFDLCKRPLYSTEDVRAFLLAALQRLPFGQPDRRLIRRKLVIEIDPAALSVPHGLRKAMLVS